MCGLFVEGLGYGVFGEDFVAGVVGDGVVAELGGGGVELTGVLGGDFVAELLERLCWLRR